MISSIISRIVIVRKYLKYFANILLTPVYLLTSRKVRHNRLKNSSSSNTIIEKHHHDSTTFTSDISKCIVSVFKFAIFWEVTSNGEEISSTIDEHCPTKSANNNYWGEDQNFALTSDVEYLENFTISNWDQETTSLTSDRNSSAKMPGLLKPFAHFSILKPLIVLGVLGVLFTKTLAFIAIYPVFRLVFGTLYPAYASYKAVKTKNVKEYVKWMMYWIVFALFTCTETFTDIFLSWFPFYYEIKIILVIWLLSPATKGSSILYRKFVHPTLSSREQEIDEYISKAKEQSYRQVLDLGQKGVTALMQTAIKSGGGIVNQLKKSYSLSDLSDPTNDGSDETDDVLLTDPRLVRRRKPGRSPHRSNSASSASVYFSEVNVVAGGMAGGDRVAEVRSVEDISSGYSSGECLYASHHQPLKPQARESIASQRTNSLTRSRSTRVTRSSVPKKSSVASDDSDENEVFDTNIIFLNDQAKKSTDKPWDKHDESSSSEAEFFDMPENILGFQLHDGKILDSAQQISNNNKDVDDSKQIVKRNQIDYSNNGASTVPALLGYDNDNKITACKSDISSSSLSFNLTKLSSALSSLYPSYSSYSKGKTDEGGKTSKLAGQESAGLHQKSAQSDSKEYLPVELIRNAKEDSTSSTIRKIPEIRGGKYNKKHAPLPPLPPKRESTSASAIKATLVLQPGVVRSLSLSAESLNKEIFLNYSPKVRRRSRNQSPASRSSKSSSDSSASSSKVESALSKMLRLPKKVAHLNIPGKIKDKRHSWGDFFHTKKLVESKIQSKSASNLGTIAENEKSLEVAKPIRRSGSQISIKSLTDSPLAHRRIKVIRRYVDNDID